MPFPKTPALTADCVVIDGKGRLLLIRRGHPPFKGQYALPGGFAEVGETIEQTCRRELLEETAIKAGRLELLGVYSDPKRDPRGHTCSVVFMTSLSCHGSLPCCSWLWQFTQPSSWASEG